MASNIETVRILHISDTHGLHRDIEKTFPMPEADILVHTGDFTDNGDPAEFEDFNNWLGELSERYPVRLVSFGNHEYRGMRSLAGSLERLLDPLFVKGLLPNATVLEHEAVTISGLRFYGSPWCPWHPSSAPGDDLPDREPETLVRELWQASQPEGREHRFDEIPAGVDILLTHGSPTDIMDYCEMGSMKWGSSRALREAVLRARPRVHLFGHIHEQRGVWRHEPNQPFEGGIEYELPRGKGMHPTWSEPPPADYPCEIISCNAMKNHPNIDASQGGDSDRRIAGPARLIVATRSVHPGSESGSEAPETWQFSIGSRHTQPDV